LYEFSITEHYLLSEIGQETSEQQNIEESNDTDEQTKQQNIEESNDTDEQTKQQNIEKSEDTDEQNIEESEDTDEQTIKMACDELLDHYNNRLVELLLKAAKRSLDTLQRRFFNR
jgi:HD-GYP domain-containing protein (c-di-GMP phosphodiesterase class II)